MYRMFGAPSGAFGGRYGVQSGTESRMSRRMFALVSLVTDVLLGGWSTVADVAVTLTIASPGGSLRHPIRMIDQTGRRDAVGRCARSASRWVRHPQRSCDAATRRVARGSPRGRGRATRGRRHEGSHTDGDARLHAPDRVGTGPAGVDPGARRPGWPDHCDHERAGDGSNPAPRPGGRAVPLL